MSESRQNPLSQRYAHWYAHERDCNAKVLAMLESVPVGRRGDPQFRKAVDLMAHMIFWRLKWLKGMGHPSPLSPDWKPEGTPLEDLASLVRATEAAWISYFATLDDAALARDTTWTASDGTPRMWRNEHILHQVAGHHWYHRGQITLLVTMLGGTPVSTDYFFYDPPRKE